MAREHGNANSLTQIFLNLFNYPSFNALSHFNSRYIVAFQKV